MEDGLKEVSGDKSSYVDSVGDWIFDTFPARTYTYRVMAAVDISEKILSEDVFETTIYSDLSEPDSGYTFPYGATLDSASQGLYGDKVVLTYSTPAYVDSAILYCSKLLVNVRVCSLPLGQPRGSVYQDVRETLIPGKKYEYRIKVYKNDLDTVTDYKSGYRKLAPPENFRVVYAPDRYVDGFADTARILLSWDSVNNVKGYNLYIKRGEGVTKDNFDDSLQFDTSATLHYEFVPDEFKENTDSIFDYSFAISSFMANGSESDLSDVDNGAVRSFSVENLRASNSLFDKKIRLSWSAPRYGKDEIESYEIFRKKDENDFERLTLATIKDLYDDTTFEDSDNLLQGSVYYYKIKTNYTDAKATSIFSDTSTCGSLPLEDVNLRVSKNKDSLVVELDSVNGADAYLLWKNEGSSQFDSEVFDTLHAGDYSGETISYKDEAVEAGHFYFYQLKAIRIVGSDTIFSNAETDYGYQKLVLDSVYAKVDSGGVRLSWSRSVNLGSLVPVEYHLYRKPVNGDWSLTNISSVLDSTIEPDDTIYTYLDKSVEIDSYYYYRLNAVFYCEEDKIDFMSDELGQLYGYEWSKTYPDYKASDDGDDTITVLWPKIEADLWDQDPDKDGGPEEAPPKVTAYIVKRVNIDDETSVAYDTVAPSDLISEIDDDEGTLVYSYYDYNGGAFSSPIPGKSYHYSIGAMIRVNNSPDLFYSDFIYNHNTQGTGKLKSASLELKKIYPHYDATSGEFDGLEVVWKDNNLVAEGYIIEKDTSEDFATAFRDSFVYGTELDGVLFTDSSYIDYQSADNWGILGDLMIGNRYFYRVKQVNNYQYGVQSSWSDILSEQFKYDQATNTAFIYTAEDFNSLAENWNSGAFAQESLNIRLMNSIDFDDVGLIALGSPTHQFQGSFKGGGNKVNFEKFADTASMFAVVSDLLVDSLTISITGEITSSGDVALLAGQSSGSVYRDIQILLNGNSLESTGGKTAGLLAYSQNDSLFEISMNAGGGSLKAADTLGSMVAVASGSLFAQGVSVEYLELMQADSWVGGLVGAVPAAQTLVLKDILLRNVEKMQSQNLGGLVGHFTVNDSFSFQGIELDNIEDFEQETVANKSYVGFVVGLLKGKGGVDNLSVSGSKHFYAPTGDYPNYFYLGAIGYADLTGDTRLSSWSLGLPLVIDEISAPSKNVYLAGVAGFVFGSCKLSLSDVVVDGDRQSNLCVASGGSAHLGGLIGYAASSGMEVSVQAAEVRGLDFTLSGVNSGYVGGLLGRARYIYLDSVVVDEEVDLEVKSSNKSYLGSLIGMVEDVTFEGERQSSSRLALSAEVGTASFVGGLFGKVSKIEGLQADKFDLALDNFEGVFGGGSSYAGIVAGYCAGWQDCEMKTPLWDEVVDGNNVKIKANKNVIAGVLFGYLRLTESDTFMVANVSEFNVEVGNAGSNTYSNLGLLAGNLSDFGTPFSASVTFQNSDNIKMNITGEGKAFVGGLVGRLDYYSILSRSGVSGLEISADAAVDATVGLITGFIPKDAAVKECYAYNCLVTNCDMVGLIAGKQIGDIASCYTLQNRVEGAANAGGLVGEKEGGSIDTCYTLGNINVDTTVAISDYADINAVCTTLTSVLLGGHFSESALFELVSAQGYPSLVNCPQEDMPLDNGLELTKGFGDDYRVTNCLQMDAIGDVRLSKMMGGYDQLPDWLRLDASYILAADLDFSDYDPLVNYTSIGYEEADTSSFSGSFDGDNRWIKNLQIKADQFGVEVSGSKRGVFGYILDGKVANLALDSVNNAGGSNFCGVLAGFAKGAGGSIQNILITNSSVASSSQIGLVAGKVMNQFSIKDVLTIDNTVYANGALAGAIAGIASDTCQMMNVVSVGDSIKGSDNVGGIAGVENKATLTNIYSLAKAVNCDDDDDMGKIVSDGDLEGCYSLAETEINGEYQVSVDPAGKDGGNLFYNHLKEADFQPLLDDASAKWEFKRQANYPTLRAFDDDLDGELAMVATPFDESSTPGVYKVEDVNDLLMMGGYTDDEFKLMNSIDLSTSGIVATSGDNFIPIGDQYYPFTGVFDGDKYSIKGLRLLSEDGGSNRGLFGKVAGGTIKKLGLVDAQVSGESNVGCLVGSLVGGEDPAIMEDILIENSSAQAEGNYVGGVIGWMFDATAERVIAADVTVRGNRYVGGIVGSGGGGATLIKGVALCDTLEGGQGYEPSKVTDELITTSNCVSINATVGDWDTTRYGADKPHGKGVDLDLLRVESFYKSGSTVDFLDAASSNWEWLGGTWSAYPCLKNMNTDCDLRQLAFRGGSGAPSDPYGVYCASSLERIEENPGMLGKHYRQEQDLDLDGKDVSQIGDKNAIFYGSYDGQGYEVKNLKIDEGTNYVGMFGYAGGNAVIQRVVVVDPDFLGDECGGVVAYLIDNAELKNCLVKYADLFGISFAGGLVGWLTDNAEVSGCVSIIKSVPYLYSGGAVGYLHGSAKISNTVVLGGEVGNSNSSVERVVGQDEGEGGYTVENVYALETIFVNDTIVTDVSPGMENTNQGATFSLNMGEDAKTWWELIVGLEFTETGVTSQDKPWFWSGQDFPVLRSGQDGSYNP